MILAIAPGIVVIVPMALNLIIAPLVICNQHELIKYATVRDIVNELRDHTNKFKGENTRMGKSVDELEDKVGTLKGVESKLQEIVAKQGSNVEELVALVNEHKQIVAEMKEIVQGELVQILTKAVMDGDTDKNGILDDDDTENVLNRLRNIEHVITDEDKFRNYVKRCQGNINSVLGVVAYIFKDEVSEDDRIFVVKPVLGKGEND